MNKSMTALMCLFARAYHQNNSNYKVYNDELATKIITLKEYNEISDSLAKGINYFNPDFKGTHEETLKWIMNNQIVPTIVGRSEYTKKMLNNAIRLGCKQYLIFASGYDTSGYNQPISTFELDQKNIINDKKERIKNLYVQGNVNYIPCDFTKSWLENLLSSNYNRELLSFSSLLGLSYYLTKEEFKHMLKNISDNICYGSSIIFDYQTYEKSNEVEKNEELATEAGEVIKSRYSITELTKILEEFDLLIYENLNNTDIDNTIFKTYNSLNPNARIYAPIGINYCLCVKKC